MRSLATWAHPANPKSRGREVGSFPLFSDRNCRSIWQAKGDRGSEPRPEVPPPQAPFLAGSGKAWTLSPAPNTPLDCHMAQKPASRPLTFQEKICPPSDVSHSILKSFLKGFVFSRNVSLHIEITSFSFAKLSDRF